MDHPDPDRPAMPSAPPAGPISPAPHPPAWSGAMTLDDRDWRRRAGPLPGSVQAAAIVLMVLGGLVTIFALLFVLGGAMAGQLPAEFYVDDPTFGELTEADARALVQATVWVMAAVVLLVAIGHFVGGIGALKRRNWGRITALVISGLAIVIVGVGTLLGILSSGAPLPPGAEAGSGLTREEFESVARTTGIVSMVIGAVVLVAYGFVFFALLGKGRVFRPPPPRPFPEPGDLRR